VTRAIVFTADGVVGDEMLIVASLNDSNVLLGDVSSCNLRFFASGISSTSNALD
jgi:hypothetical protein